MFGQKKQRKDEESLKQLKPLRYAVADINDESFRDQWIFKLVVLGSKKALGGNPARDHLSNERTALAYIRTCLNLVIYGLVFLQLSKYIDAAVAVDKIMKNNTFSSEKATQVKAMILTVNRFSTPIGIVVFSSALLTLLIGSFRYVRMQHLLFSPKDEFESATFFCCLIGLAFLGVSITSCVFASLL